MADLDQSGSPPVPRPPGPATDTGREGMEPHSPDAQEQACDKAPGMSKEAFWGNVRGTISREWIRLSLGTESVDKGLELSDRFVHMMEDLVSAMNEGKVIPGLMVDDAGTCTMDWYLLACFARYYGKQIGWRRDHIRDQLRKGVTLDELAQDELLGEPWGFCADPSKVPEDEREWCCPKDVKDDWYYRDLQSGRTPGESKSSPWPLVAVGIGALALVAAIFVSRQGESGPSEEGPPRANPRGHRRGR